MPHAFLPKSVGHFCIIPCGIPTKLRRSYGHVPRSDWINVTKIFFPFAFGNMTLSCSNGIPYASTSIMSYADKSIVSKNFILSPKRYIPSRSARMSILSTLISLDDSLLISFQIFPFAENTSNTLKVSLFSGRLFNLRRIFAPKCDDSVCTLDNFNPLYFSYVFQRSLNINHLFRW